MRISGLVIITVLLASSALAWNEPDGFRGLRFGSDESKATQELTELQCDTRPADIMRRTGFPERYCSTRLDVGDVKLMCQLEFRTGRLVEVHLNFSPHEYEIMEQTFIERYGSPTKITEQPIKTLGGLTTTNRIISWVGRRVVITLTRYWGSLDLAKAMLSTVQELEEQSRILKRLGKSGAKDL